MKALRNRKVGYTLIELLTVITIILILFAVVWEWNAPPPGASLSAPIVEALFQEARALAIGRQTKVRVVIHNDSKDSVTPHRYLRYLAISAEELDTDGVGVWKIRSQGTILPQRTYFDSAASRKASEVVQASNPAADGYGSWMEGEMVFPGLPQTPQACFYYQFNAEGICVQDGSTTPGAAVIVSLGTGGSQPVLDEKDKAGFLTLRNGSTSLFRDVSELTTPEDNPG